MEVAIPPESGEACHGKGSNEQMHLAGLPGWKGTAHADRSVEEPERPGTAAGSSPANRDREPIT
jgi:hypothetical protein